MADTIGYDEAHQNDLQNALVSGQFKDGTTVYPPREMCKPNSTGAIAPFLRERVTSGFPVITTDHALIHGGVAYSFGIVPTVSTSWSIALTTPTEGYVHFKPAGISASGGPVLVSLIEGATFTGGSDGTPRNMNRLKTDASTVAVKTGVTPSGGTVLFPMWIPSATNGTQKLGASATASEERVLKQNTTYVIKFDETATGDVTCGIDLFWYEESGA